MGCFSSWSVCFRHSDRLPICESLDKVNTFIKNSDELQSGLERFDISYNSDFKEADAYWETTSFAAQDDMEDDLRVLSAAFPELVFHCRGNIDDGDPEFYINAQNGELEWSYPEIAYPSFKSIFYYDSDKKKESCPYTADDLKLAISDMENTSSPAAAISAWALREMLRQYSKEGKA